MKHLFWPWQHKTRNQVQEESWKKDKYVEVEQHATKQPMDQREHQTANQKLSWNKRKHNFSKLMGSSKNSSKRENHSYIDWPQETREVPKKQSNSTPKELKKEGKKSKQEVGNS